MVLCDWSLTCEIWCCVQVESVRIVLNCKTRSWCSRIACLWGKILTNWNYGRSAVGFRVETALAKIPPLTHKSLCASLSPFSLASDPLRTSQMECNRGHSGSPMIQVAALPPSSFRAWLTVPTMDKLAVLCKMLALSLKEKDFLFGSKDIKGGWAFLFSGNAVLFKSATSLFMPSGLPPVLSTIYQP